MAKSFPLCIDRDLLTHASVSLTARVVYAQLAAYNRPRGQCNPSMQTLAGELGLTRKMVRIAVAELREEGWLKATRTSRRRSFSYTLERGAAATSDRVGPTGPTEWALQGRSVGPTGPSNPAASYLLEVGVEERARAKRDGAGPPRKKPMAERMADRCRELYGAELG
jgi:DNA-binding transcriptional MocR family regulator